MDWFLAPVSNLLFVALGGIGIYAVLIACTRWAGVRSFSKMSSFDFAITVAIGSVIAGVMMAKSPPLLQGVVALLVLFAIQMGVAVLRMRFPSVVAVVDNEPRLIMVGGDMLHDQMRAARITDADLRAKLRAANVLDFARIEAVVAETTGDISVLQRGEGSLRLDPALLQDVSGAERFPGRRAVKAASESRP